MTQSQALQAVITEAHKWLGTSSGDVFTKAIDGAAQGQSWCMCFALYCVRVVALGGNIPSPLFVSDFCLKVWNSSPLNCRSLDPVPGAVVVYEFGLGPSGHAGIVIASQPSVGTFTTIEGNTTPTPGLAIVAKGDGVYQKTRSVRGSGQMSVKGFLLPFGPLVNTQSTP